MVLLPLAMRSNVSRLARVRLRRIVATVVIAQNGAPDCQVTGSVDVVTNSLTAVMNPYATMSLL